MWKKAYMLQEGGEKGRLMRRDAYIQQLKDAPDNFLEFQNYSIQTQGL